MRERGPKNELLRFFLKRLEVGFQGARLHVRITWVTGLEQKIGIERPRYVSRADDRWTDAELAALRRLYPTASWEEITAALPRRTRTGMSPAGLLAGHRAFAPRALRARRRHAVQRR